MKKSKQSSLVVGGTKMKSTIAAIILILSFHIPNSVGAEMFFLPEGCLWAIAPLLQGVPISQDNLRKCVKDLINGIRETSGEVRDLRHSYEMERLMRDGTTNEMIRNNLQDDESLKGELEYIRSEIRTLKLNLEKSKKP